MHKDERYAYLQVEGSFNADDVTRSLGITPTETRDGCDLMLGAQTHSTAMWRIESDLPRTMRFEEHIANLLAKIEGSSKAFRKLACANEAWIQLVSFCTSGQENSSLNASLLRRIADLALGVDLEIYPGTKEEE